MASANFLEAPAAKTKPAKRKRSKNKEEGSDSEVSESDCGGESDGEDAQERARAAAPTKRNPEADWVEAQIVTDIRET